MVTIKPNKKINQVQLAKFIQKLSFKLPDDYVTFLKEFNGGYPDNNVVEIDFYESLSFIITSFFGIGTKECIDDILWNMEIFHERLPEGYLPIAHVEGGDVVCINLNLEAWGHIYLWLHEEEFVYKIANSFSDFMKIIKSHNPEDDDLSGYEVIDVWIDPEFLKEINGE